MFRHYEAFSRFLFHCLGGFGDCGGWKAIRGYGGGLGEFGDFRGAVDFHGDAVDEFDPVELRACGVDHGGPAVASEDFAGEGEHFLAAVLAHPGTADVDAVGRAFGEGDEGAGGLWETVDVFFVETLREVGGGAGLGDDEAVAFFIG